MSFSKKYFILVRQKTVEGRMFIMELMIFLFIIIFFFRVQFLKYFPSKSKFQRSNEHIFPSESGNGYLYIEDESFPGVNNKLCLYFYLFLISVSSINIVLFCEWNNNCNSKILHLIIIYMFFDEIDFPNFSFGYSVCYDGIIKQRSKTICIKDMY